MDRQIEVNSEAHGAVREVPVAALGISMTAVVSGSRQIVMQTHVPQDADPAEVNALLDRLGKVMDRQSAFGALEDIRKELHKHQTALTHARADKAHIDELKQLEVVRLKLEIETLQGDKKDAFEDAYAKWSASGREGSYKPKGADASSQSRFDQAIAEVHKKIEAIGAERDAASKNFDTSMQRFQEEIDRLEKEEADKLKLIEGD